MYAQAGRDLELAQRQEENVRYRDALTGAQQMGTEQRRRGQEEYLTALQTATGLTEFESRNLLDTIKTTGNLQTDMGNLALDVLEQNADWAKFIQQMGLQRETIREMVERGRLSDVADMMNKFMDLAQITQRGFVQKHRTDTCFNNRNRQE